VTIKPDTSRHSAEARRFETNEHISWGTHSVHEQQSLYGPTQYPYVVPNKQMNSCLKKRKFDDIIELYHTIFNIGEDCLVDLQRRIRYSLPEAVSDRWKKR